MIEKRLEYPEGEQSIYCPKCESTDLESLDNDPLCSHFKCNNCELEFTVRQVAVWEE